MAERAGYHKLSKEALERVLSHIPESQVKIAILYEKVLASREKNPKRLWENEYKNIFEKRQENLQPRLRLPEHKIGWFLDAVDLIGRSLELAPGNTLQRKEIEEVVKLSGLFDKKYVNPEVKRLYDNPDNWKVEKGYQDQMHSYYVGPNDLRVLVELHSRFDRDDLRWLLNTMEVSGHIKGDYAFIPTFCLAKQK